jgi:hypothetical protein
MKTSRMMVMLVTIGLLAALIASLSGTSAKQSTPTPEPTATKPLKPKQMRATAYAMLTEAARLDDATATARAETTLEAERQLAKDGKPMTPEQIAHDKELWDAVRKSQDDLIDYAAPYICGPNAIRALLRDAREYGTSPDDAWAGAERNPQYMGDQWYDQLEIFQRPLDKAVAESIGQPPDDVFVAPPTIRQLAELLNETYPGCSTGDYNGPVGS